MSAALPDRLQEVFRKVLRTKALTLAPDSSPATVPGWDSLTHMQLIAAIEAEFGIQFSFDEVSAFRSAGDIATAVASKSG